MGECREVKGPRGIDYAPWVETEGFAARSNQFVYLSIGKIKIPKKSVPAQGASRLDSVATR